MQQKVADQHKALEIAMKLETTPVKDNSGIGHIQAQLAQMALELRDMKTGKAIHEEVWCTRCRTEGHDKEQCPVVRNYLNTGAPNPFNPVILYCEICWKLASIDLRIDIYYRGMCKSPRTLTTNYVSP